MNAQSLTKPEALNLARQFVAHRLPAMPWYTYCRPYIAAILLYGSTAKGTNRPDSDIDILVFMPLEVEEQHTVGEYFYTYRGYRMNIVIRSTERLREIAAAHDDPFQKEVFRESVFLAGATGEVGRLLRRLIR